MQGSESLRVVVIGAGAMGASYGALLARAGCQVRLVDRWAEHVAAIAAGGLHLEGAAGEHRVALDAATALQAEGEADLAVVFVDSNSTADAAAVARRALSPQGAAITFQNGIGNLEILIEALGRERVLGGSSMCSAAVRGPGHVALTHLAATSVGELDGSASERVRRLAGVLEAAGLPAKVEADIVGKVWNKWVVNVAINALCATTGLRLGEVARLPELDALQDRLIDEALAVIEARGVTLPDADVRATIKAQCQRKFSKPSMLQHVDAGRVTEIDAINGACVREGRALGIPTPYNEAVVALLKGRELKRRREVHEPALDYAAWEARVAAGGE